MHSKQIQELFGLNNLTQYEVQHNRKLLQTLDYNIMTLEIKLIDLQKDVHILINDRNFFITLFQLRSRINVIQSSIRELEQNLNVAYKYLQSLSMHHLQADVMPVHQLNTILSEVQLELTKHPRLKLPLEPVGDGIWKFYNIIKVDCLIYENKIFTLMTIPLVEKDRVFDVYKIHSLPLLHPIVKKCVTFKFESPYMAISQDQLFVTYPSLDEILTCQMAQGSYCEINKSLLAVDKTKQCAMYLFKQQRSQIN